ncbi:MAG: YlmC/YmxH family sporulation protein [Oscillospiraceae bacterium]|nr:YlmC/YmxH family sporulation protein [Oscillospiraceae bacterium]
MHQRSVISVRFSELRCREVVNIKDGCRVGGVADLELDLDECRLEALVVPGKCRFFGLLGRDHDFIIPLKCVVRVGPDILLVDVDLSKVREPCKRKSFFKKS